MSKFKNIKEYCDNCFITVEDMKDMILTTALNLGCDAVCNFEGNQHQMQQAFNTLFFFAEILDEVE